MTRSEIPPTKMTQMKRSGKITNLPEGLEAEVLKYLKFEDLKHGDVLKGNLLLPEKSIYEFMNETNFDEPLRYIFRDFDNAGAEDGLRLENLKALMKNQNFEHFMQKSKSIMELMFTYRSAGWTIDCPSEDSCNRFLDWLRIQPDSPEKEFILAHRNELISLLSRGRYTRDPNQNYTYHAVLPPRLADTVKQIIKRGDQHAADLFDQLMSNQIISQWFFGDCDSRGVFHQSIIEMTKAGQSKVFFKDSIFRSLDVEALRKLATNCVWNGRVDILNECLKKLQGRELYAFYEEAVREITILAYEDDPQYDIKLAKDLIAENLEMVKNSPPIFSDEPCEEYRSGLRLTLLGKIICFGKKNPQQFMSLLEFMISEYQMAGILIKKDEALEEATMHGNHEFDQFFLDNLPD